MPLLPSAAAGGGAGPVRVAVCIVSFLRPEGLARLLEHLAGLRLDDEDEVAVRIVVVDNDPEESARPVVDSMAPRLRWPVGYVVEPARGIPQARNRALTAAAPFDFVAFIDDDEYPEPDWLAELLRVQRATGADVVTGPVIPVFDVEPPRWIRDGRFFERPRYPDRHQLTYARTSSVLIAAAAVPVGEPAFNEAMALSGGSDTHFFMRAHLASRKIVWADHAMVYESVPASRVNVRWLLGREYRRGLTLSRCLVDLDGSILRRFKRAGRAGLSFVEGTGLLLAGLVTGKARLVRGLRRWCFGAGLIAGLVGLSYQEYRVVHGA